MGCSVRPPSRFSLWVDADVCCIRSLILHGVLNYRLRDRCCVEENECTDITRHAILLRHAIQSYYLRSPPIKYEHPVKPSSLQVHRAIAHQPNEWNILAVSSRPGSKWRCTPSLDQDCFRRKTEGRRKKIEKGKQTDRKTDREETRSIQTNNNETIYNVWLEYRRVKGAQTETFPF